MRGPPGSTSTSLKRGLDKGRADVPNQQLASLVVASTVATFKKIYICRKTNLLILLLTSSPPEAVHVRRGGAFDCGPDCSAVDESLKRATIGWYDRLNWHLVYYFFFRTAAAHKICRSGCVKEKKNASQVVFPGEIGQLSVSMMA